MNDIILYHGSRGGIRGKINPVSRPACDFGEGFHLGTIKEDSFRFVSSSNDAVFYTVKLKLSEIDPDRILRLSGMDWAYFVVYNRGGLDEYKDTELYKRMSKLAEEKDVIIGKIADDRMVNTIRSFIGNKITDRELLESLRVMQLGDQYVLKTPHACSKAEIIETHVPDYAELEKLQKKEAEFRKGIWEKVNSIHRTYGNTGKKLNEILSEERKNTALNVLHNTINTIITDSATTHSIQKQDIDKEDIDL